MVSNIFRPESQFYSIDDDSFDGPSGSIALDAHILRNIGRSSNYLCLSGQQILNLIWPVQEEHRDNDQTLLSIGGAGLVWTLADKMYVPKKPILREGTLKIIHRADSSLNVYYAVGTRRSPLPTMVRYESVNNGTPSKYTTIGSAAGTDAWATVTIDGIPLDPGDTEEITIVAWISGWGSAETSTATYGAPLYSGSPGTPFECGFVKGEVGGQTHPTGIYYSGATWTESLADGEHAVLFTNSSGTAVTNIHRITGVEGSNERMWFTPHVSDLEESDVSKQPSLSSSKDAFALIVQLPRVEIACATLIAKEISVSDF